MFYNPLRYYIDTSDISMSDAGYMDSHPWAVFLRVPGCAPVRISTCVIMTRKENGWDKAVLMDCNQLSLPSVRSDGFRAVYNHQYPENYQIEQLPYVLARAEMIQKEFDDLAALGEKERAEYEAKEAADHAAYVARSRARKGEWTHHVHSFKKNGGSDERSD